jgi:tetratricopeptide (TPR) repeat protein
VFFLVAATVAVFWQVRDHEFVYHDDDMYVYENPHVQAGLTSESVRWAFTTGHFANWHPLTWLSHMLDCQLFGMIPGLHHVSSLLFHVVNTALLFLILRRMTGESWRSAFVAALFALHPLRAEPVAWISSRKDVLSSFFFMITLLAYARYAERPRVLRYFMVLLSFALGLMAKPMLVTLPFVLLLVDYWPLARVHGELSAAGAKARFYWRLLREKLPLFALAAASSVVTYIVMQRGGGIESLNLPFRARVMNALVAYVVYMGKMFWPRRLAAIYPHPGDSIPQWQVAGSVLLLVCVSAAVVRSARRHPHLAVGWFWYLGTLVPVIGLVQVGYHAMADRYTYVPLIGLFIMVAWGVPESVARWRHRRVGLAVAALAVLLALMVGTWFQVGYWRDSVTLFEHAISVTSDNDAAHTHLGMVHLHQERLDEAREQFAEAVRINPEQYAGWSNMGVVLRRQGELEESVACFSEALRIKPDFAAAHNNLGMTLFAQGKLDAAVEHYRQALEIERDCVIAHCNLGRSLLAKGALEEAASHFSEAAQLDPNCAEAYSGLGSVLLKQGETGEAIEQISKALRIDPDNVDAHHNLGVAMLIQGNNETAAASFSQVLRLKPEDAEAHFSLGMALMAEGRLKGAAGKFEDVLGLRPDHREARAYLERIRQAQRKSKKDG